MTFIIELTSSHCPANRLAMMLPRGHSGNNVDCNDLTPWVSDLNYGFCALLGCRVNGFREVAQLYDEKFFDVSWFTVPGGLLLTILCFTWGKLAVLLQCEVEADISWLVGGL